MDVHEHTAAGKSEYKGQTYYFCSMICKEWFDKEPERYFIPVLPELKRLKRRTKTQSERTEQT